MLNGVPAMGVVDSTWALSAGHADTMIIWPRRSTKITSPLFLTKSGSSTLTSWVLVVVNVRSPLPPMALAKSPPLGSESAWSVQPTRPPPLKPPPLETLGCRI